MESDPEFLLRRAKEESVQALTTDQAEAAEVHPRLAVRYSARAARLWPTTIRTARQDQLVGLPSVRWRQRLNETPRIIGYVRVCGKLALAVDEKRSAL